MEWINKWNSWVSVEPVAKGVWARRDGGFYVKGAVVSPKTGKPKDVRKNLPDCKTAEEARQILTSLLENIRRGEDEAQKSIPRFCEFAASFAEERTLVQTAKRGWRSASTRRVSAQRLTHDLLPRFGDYFIDKISAADMKQWVMHLAGRIREGKMKPSTANKLISLMRSIVKAYCLEYKLENPMAAVELFDTSEHRTYSREQPNSLTPEEVRAFLEATRKHFPQYFALFALGFATGLRPSSLRPLRLSGDSPDIDLKTGTLQIRRSHSGWNEEMQCTKQATCYEIQLPETMVEILRWHISMIQRWNIGNRTNLLFPGKNGYMGTCTLSSVFRKIAKLAGISKKLTPRSMRRTFQDLARQSRIDNFVTRSISGHASESMQERYSTIYGSEQREGLAKLISLAGFREVQSRMHSQVHETECDESLEKQARK